MSERAAELIVRGTCGFRQRRKKQKRAIKSTRATRTQLLQYKYARAAEKYSSSRHTINLKQINCTLIKEANVLEWLCESQVFVEELTRENAEHFIRKTLTAFLACQQIFLT
jgi:hypothetical protein